MPFDVVATKRVAHVGEAYTRLKARYAARSVKLPGSGVKVYEVETDRVEFFIDEELS